MLDREQGVRFGTGGFRVVRVVMWICVYPLRATAVIWIMMVRVCVERTGYRAKKGTYKTYMTVGFSV